MEILIENVWGITSSVISFSIPFAMAYAVTRVNNPKIAQTVTSIIDSFFLWRRITPDLICNTLGAPWQVNADRFTANFVKPDYTCRASKSFRHYGAICPHDILSENSITAKTAKRAKKNLAIFALSMAPPDRAGVAVN